MYRPVPFTALEPADRQVQVPVQRWCAVKGRRTKKEQIRNRGALGIITPLRGTEGPAPVIGKDVHAEALL
ncbi:hypothetical protein M431DRAFT_211689 [Trichoderma harzianum CBS 226.95]|uniref:Uncharacterized protein n=1 Tax=Trichoderma harzianum CBS 226.95 TaxID=983964 RepID=A0A2T4A4X1_TRIHA|nr:hypothetical protein M431DRAFT_211689 [Trichoderma harzianum CBS 226.95]PTB52122.1 hypothetical protein M431DRAFT_211689 [Trichoderma harzianum CBS 226.95]